MYFYQSECLKEVFNELDTSSDVLQILMSPDAPFLQLSTFGNAGSTHVSGVTQWPILFRIYLSADFFLEDS